MRRFRRGFWLVLIAGLVAGLGWLGLGTRYGQALWASTDSFDAWGEDPRVFFEPGMETEARAVAHILPEAIRQIEQLQQSPFSEPIRVYLCATQERFNRHVPRGTNARGAVFRRSYIQKLCTGKTKTGGVS